VRGTKLKTRSQEGSRSLISNEEQRMGSIDPKKTPSGTQKIAWAKKGEGGARKAEKVP